MPDRPNILYIMTDQQSAFAMSCMGNQDLSTPAADQLAQTGVLFENTYCTQPLCTPARGSMFTGLMPHQCGTTENGLPIKPELRAQELGRVMSDAGYECAYGGKWHVPEGSMPSENDHGFRTICGFSDAKLPDACAEFLGEKRDQPFFLVASFDNPHNICEWGRSQCLPWGSIGEPPPPEECPNLPANFEIPPFEPEILRIEQRCHWAIYPTVDYTEDDWRRHRWAYYRLTEKVDREIARVLDALKKAGLEQDTVVIFSSDHGDGHGAHRWNQKSILYEEVVRVPLIVSWTGVTSGRQVDREHLVSNGLDLFPTICDYAGVDVPESLPGLSLRPLAEGQSAEAWREAVFAETYFDGGRGYNTLGRMVRTARYKYMCYDKGHHREQLIDLQRDPGEMVNLAVESRHRGALAEHRLLLADYIAETRDCFHHLPGHHDGYGAWR